MIGFEVTELNFSSERMMGGLSSPLPSGKNRLGVSTPYHAGISRKSYVKSDGVWKMNNLPNQLTGGKLDPVYYSPILPSATLSTR
jgi:hypothetical protein